MKISVYIATTLDGFIARQDGRLDWLPGADGQPTDSEEDYGYSQFISGVDAIVMGRNTFETVLSFGEWPYRKRVIVLSSRLVADSKLLPSGVTILSGPPEQIVRRVEAEKFQHLYLDGGNTVQRFLQAGLVNELIIPRVPVLIGSGIPLFGNLQQDVKLKHLKTAAIHTGFVQTH